MKFLQSLIQPFRFISRYYARQAVKRMRQWRLLEAERDHQALLLKTFLASLETIQKTSAQESSANAQALMEVAKGMTAQAASFGEWLKLFSSQGQCTTSVVTEEDEYKAEQLKAFEAGMPADIAALPEEFRLAWVLQNDPLLKNV